LRKHFRRSTGCSFWSLLRGERNGPGPTERETESARASKLGVEPDALDASDAERSESEVVL
jgi:hypothetical protein